jgi:hypothetical protein
MVPRRGLEPPPTYVDQHLKLARLPIPPTAPGFRFILDDLDRIDPERWTVISYQDLLENPDAEIKRLCEFSEIRFDAALRHDVATPLPHSRLTLTALAADKWKKNASEIERILPDVLPVYERILETVSRDMRKPGRRDPLRQSREKPTANEAVSRMQPCPCGSGKRYKHCHGALNKEA